MKYSPKYVNIHILIREKKHDQVLIFPHFLIQEVLVETIIFLKRTNYGSTNNA